MPYDHPRPKIPTFRGSKRYLALSEKLTENLKTLAKQEGVTLFMTLLAAFKTLLYRYSGQNDIIVGTVASVRSRPEFEPLIGYLLNTLALRADLSGEPTFLQLLKRVRKVTADAYANNDVPFKKVAETFITGRHLGQMPFSQVGFNLDPPMPPIDLQWTIKQYEIDNGAAKIDLLMGLEEKPEGLTGYIEYNADLFEAATIERIIENFEALIKSIVANPQQPISELPVQIESESTSTYPLSSSQWPVWCEQTLRPNQAMLNIGGYTRINGQIDSAVFEKALNRVIADNDALRIIICKKNNQPTQRFAENIRFR